MEKIILVSPKVVEFLNQLVCILYNEAISVLKKVHTNTLNNYEPPFTMTCHILRIAKPPPQLKEYGNYYAKIKGSKRTTWYVFFDKWENRYLNEFIANNHMPQSTHLNNL